MTEPFKFNWQEEQKSDTFLSWALVTLLGPFMRRSSHVADFDKLSETTDHFEKCELTVFLNGIEMDAPHFFDRLEEAIDDAIERGVARRVAELDLTAMYEGIDDLQRGYRVFIREKAAALGITIREEDD